MKRPILGLTLILLAGVVWWNFFRERTPPNLETRLPAQAVEVLEGAEQMTLFSLDPGPFPPDSTVRMRFHANTILGETLIPETGQRRQIARELQQVVSISDGDFPMCFEPRHGLRVK